MDEFEREWNQFKILNFVVRKEKIHILFERTVLVSVLTTISTISSFTLTIVGDSINVYGIFGTQWELYIPSELAYGDSGSPPKIGGGEVLIFQMEILAILGDTKKALQCNIDKDEACNEKELKYIAKVKSWYADKATQYQAVDQLVRIRRYLSDNMKDELRDWAERRENILQQFVDKQYDVAKSEL